VLTNQKLSSAYFRAKDCAGRKKAKITQNIFLQANKRGARYALKARALLFGHNTHPAPLLGKKKSSNQQSDSFIGENTA
jgi:hypothetical protein